MDMPKDSILDMSFVIEKLKVAFEVVVSGKVIETMPLDGVYKSRLLQNTYKAIRWGE